MIFVISGDIMILARFSYQWRKHSWKFKRQNEKNCHDSKNYKLIHFQCEKIDKVINHKLVIPTTIKSNKDKMREIMKH